MSKFTTEVRFICETYAGLDESKGLNSVNEILTEAAPKVFDFDFPIYDESHRLPLEIKILRHYYTREISAETVGRWKLFLEDRMNEIMPYYNKLYESEEIEFDPMSDTDYKTVHEGDTTSHGTVSGSDSRNSSDSGTRTSRDSGSDARNWEQHDKSSHWSLYSDTPQGGINGIESASDPSLGNNGYLTNATHDIHDGTGTGGTDTQNYGRVNTQTDERTNTQTGSTQSTSSQTGTNDYTDTVTGKRGAVSYSKMLEEYRQTIINIDKMIIDDLSDLFFTLWE